MLAPKASRIINETLMHTVSVRETPLQFNQQPAGHDLLRWMTCMLFCVCCFFFECSSHETLTGISTLLIHER